MPWQHSGVEIQRTWPVAPDADTLRRRWHGLLTAPDRAKAYKEARDRKVTGVYSNEWLTGDTDRTPIAQLSVEAPLPGLVQYGYRYLDRHYLIADSRLVSYPRPELWRACGPQQIFFVSLLKHPLGHGPALMASTHVPDRHFFRGSFGGKDVLPLYRSQDGVDPNLLPGLVDLLRELYGEAVSTEDFAAYLYGVLAHPDFVSRHFDQLDTCEVRVPITKNPDLFSRVEVLGRLLLHLHTYGERCLRGADRTVVSMSHGSARCLKPVPGSADGYPESFSYNEATRTLHVGNGAFAPVAPETWHFEVSGLKVLHSWLAYRMKKGAGKKSSPLDDIRPERWTAQFTTDLLELLYVLEATLKLHREQARLLDEVLAGDCFVATELPAVPDEARKAPRLMNGPQQSIYDSSA